MLRKTTIAHTTFAHFAELVRPNDVLVINETRVVRARLHGHRASGGAVEILLLRPADGAFDYAKRRWLALVRPARRLHAGERIDLADGAHATIVDALEDGPRVIDLEIGESLDRYLERHGEVPLPPYVGPGDDARAARYQTVFARVPGSVAAPTASLHFTAQILSEVRARGAAIVPLVLDVGIGTFRPIATERVTDHVMHAERYDIPAETAAAIARARASGGRVIAAGTTVMRALEGAAERAGDFTAGSGETSIYITPGFRFRVVDALLTNFHLPKSTLLVLVSAFAGYDRVRAAYAAAVAERYRFFSFGDAMFCERNDSVSIR